MGRSRLCPFENLIGQAEVIFFSIDKGEPAWQVWRWPSDVRWSRIFQRVRASANCIWVKSWPWSRDPGQARGEAIQGASFWSLDCFVAALLGNDEGDTAAGRSRHHSAQGAKTL